MENSNKNYDVARRELETQGYTLIPLGCEALTPQQMSLLRQHVSAHSNRIPIFQKEKKRKWFFQFDLICSVYLA